MNRRQAIKGGVTLGALATAGSLARYAFLPPRRSPVLEPVETLARRLFDSLDPEQRGQACVAYDHPWRQYHNRGVQGGGLDVDAWKLSWEQRRLLTDLFHAGLSERGRGIVTRQWFVRWPGTELMRFVFCGDPHEEDWQLVLTGPHLNLRLGGASREGVAFGGPLVYGDQRGNERPGLPGNVYLPQLEAAWRLVDGLEPAERERATLATAPIQTRIEVQGARAAFPGVEAADLPPASRAALAALVDEILSPWPEDDVAHAKTCIAENGGIEALRFALYEDGEVSGSGRSQVFRVEGPGTVLHFRGAPHVHAFVNVAMDAENPLSVGEVVATNETERGDADVQRLFEDAMRHATGSELAWYPRDAVVGRLRGGPIREGDVYVLESWQDRVATARIPGKELGEELRAERAGGSSTLDPAREYLVATTTTAAKEGRAGSTGRWEHGPRLRQATIAYLRERGL